jgi:hypothetical protein
MSIVSLTLRTWVRYLGPFALLALITCGPLFWIFFKLAPTLDPMHARARLPIGIALAWFAWLGQLVLVAAVAPGVRGLFSGAPIAQARAITDGVAGIARAIVPVATVFAAVVLGGLALVVPGLALLVLLALTGASEHLGEPLPAPLLDSIAVARASFARITIVVALALVVDIAIADGGQLALLGTVTKKPTPPQLAAMKLSPYVALALGAVSPLVACALAACHTVGGRDRS